MIPLLSKRSCRAFLKISASRLAASSYSKQHRNKMVRTTAFYNLKKYTELPKPIQGGTLAPDATEAVP